ncbi:GH1 family beta-glucosidase [Lentzea californiensis]|uniref:GH1 family beta-glucosidase n=1 Tax=Lentzea californiensis TaxID=438851 RepID=UPI0021643BE4|nr:GH1 family beta-glucosidase [Lentzea californiensis]MCR3748624.1 broad-specificity cellobiase (EC 3.2.1.21) [Lentzea californiensis]
MTTDSDVEVGQEVLTFPPDFLWGAATAAFQIEGATTADGRGASIWDTFAATPGKVLAGDTGDPACDHYHRYRSDVDLMESLGLASYRFSVAWPRIQPNGSGKVEERGLAFYDRLVDSLLEKDIQPLATLYHWDLPQVLEDFGGWRNRDTAYRFAEYAAIVHERLGDRVQAWTTLNEPWVSAFLGYGNGIHAPGITDAVASLEAAHHLLLAHGLATQALRAQAPESHRLSIVLNFSTIWGDDAEAVRKVDGLQNRILLDPVLGKGYPLDVLQDTTWLGDWTNVVRDGDMETIATPVDWIGVNYYNPTRVAPADPDFVPAGPHAGLRGVSIQPPQGELTGFGWEQNADAFTELLVRLSRDTAGVPLVVTENGSAFPDVVDPAGRVYDVQRTKYLVDHVRAVHRAISEGADIRGYLAWSLLDNFEWAAGYSQRFGIVHVDFETQQRTVKESAATLSRIIGRNGLPAHGYTV